MTLFEIGKARGQSFTKTHLPSKHGPHNALNCAGFCAHAGFKLNFTFFPGQFGRTCDAGKQPCLLGKWRKLHVTMAFYCLPSLLEKNATGCNLSKEDPVEC